MTISNEMLVASVVLKTFADVRVGLTDDHAAKILKAVDDLGSNASLQERVETVWNSTGMIVHELTAAKAA